MSTAPKSVRSPANPAGEAGKEAMDTATAGAETIVRAAADTAEKAASMAHEETGPALSMARESFDSALNAAGVFGGYEDLVQFNKDNFEAMVKSSTIVVRGVQDMSKLLVNLTQENIEESVAAGKSLIGITTLKEFFDVSSTLARSNFDKMVTESARLSQLSTRLAEEAFAPLSTRVDATIEKLGRARQTRPSRPDARP